MPLQQAELTPELVRRRQCLHGLRIALAKVGRLDQQVLAAQGVFGARRARVLGSTGALAEDLALGHVIVVDLFLDLGRRVLYLRGSVLYLRRTAQPLLDAVRV